MLFLIPVLCVIMKCVYSNTDLLYDIPNNEINKKVWKQGSTIQFILPDNDSVTGSVNHIQYFQNAKEIIFISGTVNPIPNTNRGGTFSASFYKEFMNANIHYDGDIQYELRPYKDQEQNTDRLKYTYMMRKVNMTHDYYSKEKEKEKHTHIYNHLRKRVVQQNTAIHLENTVTLKVLVLYTKQAVVSIGNENSLIATITLAIGNFNLALQNSLVNVVVDYVAERIQEYDTFIEDADMGTMVGRLGSSISTDRRNILHCHAVQLVTQNTQYCGIADYAPNGLTSGYSASFYGCIGGYFTLAHEISHNIGLHHDFSGFGGTGPNHGYCWDDATGISNCHRSIMAYGGCVTPNGRTNCDRVKYFSSPQVFEMGNPVGVLNSCDNAQQFRNNIQNFMNQFEPQFINLNTIPSTITPTETPTVTPSQLPSQIQTQLPSQNPSQTPSQIPSQTPSQKPSQKPSQTPSQKPIQKPSQKPSQIPSQKPSVEPSQTPSQKPTENPTQEPSVEPSQIPTENPTQEPSVEPSQSPTEKPTQEPSLEPSAKYSLAPTSGSTVCNITTGLCYSTHIKIKNSNDYFYAYITVYMFVSLALIYLCILCIVRTYSFKDYHSSKMGNNGGAAGEANPTDISSKTTHSISINLSDIYKETSNKIKKKLSYNNKDTMKTYLIDYNSNFENSTAPSGSIEGSGVEDPTNAKGNNDKIDYEIKEENNNPLFMSTAV